MFICTHDDHILSLFFMNKVNILELKTPLYEVSVAQDGKESRNTSVAVCLVQRPNEQLGEARLRGQENEMCGVSRRMGDGLCC